MKTSKLSLAILAAAGLLAFASSVPAQNSTNSTPPPARRGGRMTVEAQLNRLTEQLTLTDDQKPKVKAVLEEQNKQRQELRSLPQEERQTKAKALREDMNKKFKEILTGDQFKKYQELQKSQRRRSGAGGNAPAAPGGAATKTE